MTASILPALTFWIPLLAVVALYRPWRHSFALSVFLAATLVMNVIGQVGLLVGRSVVERQFPVFELFRLREADIVHALQLMALGLLFAVFGHVATRFCLTSGMTRTHNPEPETDLPRQARFGRRAVVTGSVVAFLGAVVVLEALFRMGPSSAASALLGGGEVYFLARRSITNSYLFSITSYNILPYVTTILVVLTASELPRTGESRRLRLLSRILLALTIVALLLTFQKRPLAVFFGMLIVGRLSLAIQCGELGLRDAGRYSAAVVGVVSIIVILMGVSTTRHFSEFGVQDGLQRSVTAVGSRVVGRLSIPGPMYVRMFPEVEPHYGLKNTRLATIVGTERYEDTPQVYEYFTGDYRGGSVAVPAIFDFWGGFGLPGVILGGLLIGSLLAAADSLLARMPGGARKSCFMVGVMVFAWFLTQASVLRSLAGYGGLIFLALWLIVFRLRRSEIEMFS